jgi:hypothetical protein
VVGREPAAGRAGAVGRTGRRSPRADTPSFVGAARVGRGRAAAVWSSRADGFGAPPARVVVADGRGAAGPASAERGRGVGDPPVRDPLAGAVATVDLAGPDARAG